MKKGLVKLNTVAKAKNKHQAAYEKLLENIENQKTYIKNIETGLDKAYSKIRTELQPLIKETNELLREYLLRLDTLADEIGVGKLNMEWFVSYMVDELYELLDVNGYQDKEVAKLYEKYTGSSIADLADSEENREAASLFSEMFGFEVDINEVLEKGESQYIADHQHEILKNLHKKLHAEENETDPHDAAKKKSSKQLAEEKKIKQENELLASDARAIYMRLMKKMHPDLERDEAKKKIKTEITKKVTEAYKNNDFFSLLKLQIEHLEEGDNDAEHLADDMLKRYNKILKRQLEEMKARISKSLYSNGTVIEDFFDKNGKFSTQKFNAQRNDSIKQISFLKEDLKVSFKKSKTWFKEQIKNIKEEQNARMMDEMFQDLFSDMPF